MSNVTKTARTVIFNETGGPEVLRIERISIPDPAPHEVCLAVKAIGLNRVDTMFRYGYYSEKPVFPSKLGFEAAGIVESVGVEVAGIKPGDKVSVVPAFSNHDYGTYGELILVPGYAVQKYPEHLSFEEAAAIWTSFIAAYGMLVDAAGIQPGQIIVINAASSSMGLAAIQTANLLGGIPIALTTSADKKEALLLAGAKHVVVTSGQHITDALMAISDGKGVNIVLDAVSGGSQFQQIIAATAERAKVYAYGMLSMEPTVYPAGDVLLKMLTIVGYNMGDLLMDQSKSAAAIAFVKEGLLSGKLKPTVARVFPLEDVIEAHRFLEAGKQFGKVVMRC